MKSYPLALAPLMGLCLLQAQSAPQIPFETVPEPPQSSSSKASGPTIESIEFRGTSRVSQATLRVLVVSRVGSAYDRETLRKDSEALYKTGRFSDINWETEPGRTGTIVRFTVAERPLIQSIEYRGDDTVTIPEILERFQQRKIKLREETLYDRDELPRAAAIVQELATERGRQNVTVTPLVETFESSSTVKITFRVEEKK